MPQQRKLNRKGGAWRKTEDLIECWREAALLEIWIGVLWGYNATNDHFVQSHGIVTPDAFVKLVYTKVRQSRGSCQTSSLPMKRWTAITCRHVLDVRTTHDERIVIYDNENGHVVPIDTDKCLRPADPAFDVVFIPNALKRQKEEFLPLIAPDTVIAGEDVYSYGYFLSSSSEIATEVTNEINQGYFKGNIVNFSKSPKTPGSVSMSLSYAVVEGLSGGPVLTYHNGPKVVGMCHGNIQSRVTASEILEFKDATTEYRETITRIVEFGRAHHAAALVAFLREVKVQDFIVSSDRIQLTGLSD